MFQKINIMWWLRFLVAIPLMMYPMHQGKGGLKCVPRLDVDGWDKLRKECEQSKKRVHKVVRRSKKKDVRR
jgi:hypothetical protein